MADPDQKLGSGSRRVWILLQVNESRLVQLVTLSVKIQIAWLSPSALPYSRFLVTILLLLFVQIHVKGEKGNSRFSS
jgi:hypothetical protein